MGARRGKGNDAMLGVAMRSAKKNQQRQMKELLHATPGAIHTTDADLMAADKLKSVWEQNDLQEFLHSAEQNEKDFTAERDVRVVVQGVTHVYQNDRMKPMEADENYMKWFTLSQKLPVPQRPEWKHGMTKEQINRQETESFLQWRRKLASIEEKENILMTPYERNLEVWRQLWRVIERSDIVVDILDARNPLAFRSVACEKTVLRHKKKLILLLNKAELLTERQRSIWGKYFDDQGIVAIFFSASLAKDNQDKEAGNDPSKGRTGDGFEAPAEGEYNLEIEQQILAEEAAEEIDNLAPIEDEESVPAETASKPKAKKSRRNNKKLKGCAQPVSTEKGPHPFAEGRPERKKKEPAPAEPPTESELERTKRVDFVNKAGGLSAALKFHKNNLGKIYTPEQLIDFFLLHREGTSMEGKPVMAGFIGYPNVGKSSTINVLWESKKVNVSSTPGKTKHFQTLILPDERRVMLCDCPGLVFPSFASTRDHMIVDGILPISQLKDPIGPMHIVESRIKKDIFEMCYTLNLDWAQDLDESPTAAHYLCNAFARARGFMTDHDKPNANRAAREILQDYVAGKLVFVTPPPGMKKEEIAVSSDEEETLDDDDEEFEEEGSGEEVNWDHVMPERQQKAREETTEELFNKENANVDAIYMKMLQPKTKKANKVRHQEDADTGRFLPNEFGEIEIELDEEDCIEEIPGPEIEIDPHTGKRSKPLTKRQQRMQRKTDLRQRVGHHHKRQVTNAPGVAKAYKEPILED
eukprot:TRINITY_DN1288_c1_g1_i1.p1 TRINITY_DN1288_c1_g1~~TRINITY_DN1288_c1_g1_i1.p1  ORF type:complete len:754 (+),score=169.78 TRINITY_DN1288_c1_g1_i1:117-2378(+)